MEHKELALKYAHLVPHIWEALANLQRTGWVMRKVQNPESVQEHTIALKKLASELASSLTDFTEEEKEDLFDMLEVHDWSEAIIGDEVIYTYDVEEKKKLKEAKFQREKETMAEISGQLGEVGKKIFDLWMRFETSDDQVAQFARELDKYQAIEKAMEYQKAQGIPLFQEFYDYSSPSITHPVIMERMEKLRNPDIK